MPRAAAIIPARYASTRFPGKPLATLKGKIIIQHVYEHAVKSQLVDTVIVATDDRRIYDAVKGFGGNVVMTSSTHQSGTDRIAEAAAGLDVEVIVNVQGDEPFIRPEMIDDVIELLYNDQEASISTLARKITDPEELRSPNVVKVVMDECGNALYFSRAPIPYYRDDWQDLQHIDLEAAENGILKHIGIYGYRREALIRFSEMKESVLERVEKLEQLRALSAGMRIKVKETGFDTFGIDTLEDLRKAEQCQSMFL
ncbi:MAG: 3-deoxy-manno-octulosonate cytidylyltransferase [Nitrospira sp.]|nr:3-deoxy-manno-octulosonate cytidylyltransferase [Nitrospira sp.]